MPEFAGMHVIANKGTVLVEPVPDAALTLYQTIMYRWRFDQYSGFLDGDEPLVEDPLLTLAARDEETDFFEEVTLYVNPTIAMIGVYSIKLSVFDL